MTNSPEQFNELLDSVFRYGSLWVYVVLFAVCFIENIFPPFPGDMFILAAGGLVAVNRLMPVPTLSVIIVGGMTSVMLLYVLGRRYGRDYIVRKNFRYFNATDIARMEKRLAHWGWLILLLSRFIPGVRSVIALAAGVARYPQARMALLSATSYLVFAGLLLFSSMKLVANLDPVIHYIGLYNKIIWPILLVVVIGYVVFKYRKVRNGA